ncbi:MAG: class I SAM-dependent methyltransferase [Bacteroidota bacterium]|jgi:SAM-dependent methyltransferase|nr:class I SAM-dependent methyltransferase [Bacteroidota bacterium]
MEWFKSWFDSKYYHILYKNRNTQEAHFLIKNLVNLLIPDKNSLFLDLGCGSGRHSIELNKMGYKVDGIDLSTKSLEIAKPFENSRLKFIRADFRKLDFENKYDFILNLFTSFGYFDKENEHAQVFKQIFKSLKNNGHFVIDFLNTKKAVKNISKTNPQQTIHIDNIEFRIKKTYDNNFIYKNIEIVDSGKKISFSEKVKIITLDKFLKYFDGLNIHLEYQFGDYKLSNFDENNSDRLILIFKKKNN